MFNDRDRDDGFSTFSAVPEAVRLRMQALGMWAGSVVTVAVGVGLFAAGVDLRVPGWLLAGVGGCTVFVAVYLGIRGKLLWMYTDRGIRDRLPPTQRIKVKGRKIITARHARFTAGGTVQEPIDLGIVEDDEPETVDDLGISLAALEEFVREANARGLAESAWATPYTLRPDGVIVTPAKARQLRAWLGDHGLARKEGRARTSPWILTAPVEDIVKWLRSSVG